MYRVRNTLLYLLYAILLIVLCITIGFAFHNREQEGNNPPGASPQIVQKQPDKQPQPSTDSSKPLNTPPDKNKSKGRPQLSNPQPAQNIPQPNTGQPSASSGSDPQLLNTGPGDVVLLFISTSVISTCGYYYILTRRRYES